MQLNGINLVDTVEVLSYYEQRGLSTELIRKCNSQEYRFIDGYGKGYFLMTSDIASSSVSFTVDSRTTNLRVIDKVSLEHPNQTGDKLFAYITAEPKYELMDIIVSRSYNVTLDKSIPPTGSPTVVTLPPDLVPKTLQEVMDDFLPYALTYNGDTITSYDIAIEGLSALRAMDHLCSIYGYVWTFDGTTVVVNKITPAGPGGGEILKGLSDPINDIRHSVATQELSNVNVSFPILEYCRQDPSEYYTQEIDNGNPGKIVSIVDPYFPAVATSVGVIRNSATLDARATIIATNMEGIESLLIYVAKHHFEANPLTTTPISLSEIHGDFGSGPRSIYRSIPYPHNLTKRVYPKDRYANNWIGTLTDGYWEIVPSFVVSPLYGLDGKIPPGDQLVRNLYRWDYGQPGWTVRVEWDCVNAQWIALQQEYDCPPDEDPGYPTSPHVPPYPE